MEAFPETAATSGFLVVLRERGGDEVVHCTHPEKLGRIEAVAELLRRERLVISRHIQRALANSGLSPKSTVQKVHIASSDKPLTRYGLDAAS
jgi:hypothetical protein